MRGRRYDLQATGSVGVRPSGGPLAVALAAAVALALTVALAVSLQGPLLDTSGSVSATESASQSYGKLPLTFVPNRGQTDPSARYHAQGAGFGFYFGDEKITLDFTRKKRGAALQLRFVGANPDARLEALRPQPGKVNYLRGEQRLTNIPTYSELRYRELWPGIDMVIRGAGGKLKYEFRLAAGADPSDIRLAYAGAESLSLSAAGGLLVGTSLGTLKDTRPVAYQPIGGRKARVASRYSLSRARTGYGFQVGAYDPSRPLVIDPGLEYSTFIGGSDYQDTPYGIAVDSAGNAYISGFTRSADYPTTPGAYDTTFASDPTLSTVGDAFVTKLNADGSALVYSTFIGGVVRDPVFPSNQDFATDLAIDNQGNAYIVGASFSADFPITPGAYRTSGGPIFAAKLNPAGSALVYSTFIGPGPTSLRESIAVDAQGNAYITGETTSASFPTTPAAYDTTFNGPKDAWAVKLNPSGSAALYSTFLGPGAGTGIAVDSVGSAHLTGYATSASYPTTPGAYDGSFGGGSSDAFVTKLSADGSTLVYSTYVGGQAKDEADGIALDNTGSAYITGRPQSTNFPTTPGAAHDTVDPDHVGFVTKLNPGGSALDYSTIIAGNRFYGGDIAIDAQGNAYVTGGTDSVNLETSPNAIDRTHSGESGSYNPFVIRLNATGSALTYATYLGVGKGGVDIATHQGRAYVTGVAGSDFPTTAGAFDTTNADGDVFVSKLDTTLYGYTRPKTATPSSIRLVPAYKACTSPNGSHGAPLNLPSCNPPVQTSDFLTVGTSDSNGNAAGSVGMLGFKAVGESPINLSNGDQSDVEISFSITDVRRKGDFADYYGELKVSIPVRITDRYNDNFLIHPATLTDTTLSFISNCVATTPTSIGSTCSVNTTADAVMPGITPEFKRAIWQLGQVQIFDGGGDGDAEDANNTLFAVPGLFAP